MGGTSDLTGGEWASRDTRFKESMMPIRETLHAVMCSFVFSYLH